MNPRNACRWSVSRRSFLVIGTEWRSFQSPLGHLTRSKGLRNGHAHPCTCVHLPNPFETSVGCRANPSATCSHAQERLWPSFDHPWITSPRRMNVDIEHADILEKFPGVGVCAGLLDNTLKTRTCSLLSRSFVRCTSIQLQQNRCILIVAPRMGPIMCMIYSHVRSQHAIRSY